jgi:hypothetical protein
MWQSWQKEVAVYTLFGNLWRICIPSLHHDVKCSWACKNLCSIPSMDWWTSCGTLFVSCWYCQKVSFISRAGIVYHSSKNFLGCSNQLTLAYSENPSEIGKSGQNDCSLHDCLLMVPGNCPCVCVCVDRIFGHFAARRGDTSAACRHVFYPVSELAIFRQNACWNRQALCRKQQMLVGNDKALSANLSLAEKTSVEVYHEPTCLVGIKTTSICFSVFVVFLWYCSTSMKSGFDILIKFI